MEFSTQVRWQIYREMRIFSREILWWTTKSKLNKKRRKDRMALTDTKWWCQQTGGVWSSTAIVRLPKQKQARDGIGKWLCFEIDIGICTFYASNKDKSWYRMDWKIIWNSINKLRVIWLEKSFLWMLKEATKVDKSWCRERLYTRICLTAEEQGWWHQAGAEHNWAKWV